MELETLTPDDWRPANDVEERLSAAATAGDLPEMLRILAGAPLLVPGLRDGTAEEQRQRLFTRDREGVPYVLVFTSPEGLYRAVATDGWRVTNMTELVGGVPAGYGLAFNPATPIVVLVEPETVPTLVPTAASTADFVPANEGERLLRDALIAPDADLALGVLVTARVLAPTRAVDIDGVLTVPVFTSTERYDEFVAGWDIDLPTRSLDLVAVLQHWPGPEYRLGVNLGSPIELSLRGERVPELLRYAVSLAHRLRQQPPPDRAVPRQSPSVSTAAGATRTPDEPEPEPGPSENGNIADVLRGFH
ncbi:SseB family protein [Phytohabitans sp. ZYX-F-186]|uniref:SseB family protein n=1 Tax=Phytohabitans maris TaxID=3071409 RepID=A0ABU0ZL62_9ACTN|nr:SseB family protein [Phytohabitans sp. ZYX-F-186]MDQ7907784.1 SseB family protein [Phytohabitans sp. ZYX-F-186]